MLRVRVKLLLLFAAEVEENEIHWKRLGAAGIFFETTKFRSPSHSYSVSVMIVCGLSDKPILTSRTKIPSPWPVRLSPSFFSELLQQHGMTGHCPIAVPPSSSSCGRWIFAANVVWSIAHMTHSVVFNQFIFGSLLAHWQKTCNGMHRARFTNQPHNEQRRNHFYFLVFSYEFSTPETQKKRSLQLVNG